MLPLHSLAYFVICSTVIPISLLLVLIYLTRSKKSNTERYEVSFTNDGKIRRLRRPLGPKEVRLIGTEKNRYGIVTTVLTIESQVTLDPLMVERVMTMLSKLYPLLRMRVTKDSQTGKQYFSEMDEPNTVDFKVLEDVNAEDWVPVAEEQSLGWLDFSSGPLWGAILLKEVYDDKAKKYKNTLLFRNHHVISDGRSFIALFEQLLEYLSLLHKGEEVVVESLPLRPPCTHLMRHCCTPSVWENLVFRMMFFVARVKMMFWWTTKSGTNLYTAIFPPIILRDPSVSVVTSIIPRVFSEGDTLALMKCSKEQNCTVHGAITAATYMALAKILKKADHTLKSPALSLKTSFNVGIRKDCCPQIPRNEFGYLASIATLEATVPASSTEFWLFARECTQRVHKALSKGEHHASLSKLFDLRPKVNTAENAGRWETIFNISNLGRFELGKGKQWPYQPVARYGFTAEQTTGPVFANNLVTVNGKLSWGVTYFTNITTKEQAEEFFDLAMNILMDACKV